MNKEWEKLLLENENLIICIERQEQTLKELKKDNEIKLYNMYYGVLKLMENDKKKIWDKINQLINK